MKKAIRVAIVAVLCGALILGYYFYLAKKSGVSSTDDTEISEYDIITTKDFTEDYPKTPRETVKWYNRIIKEYYAEEHTDAEIAALAQQQRMLLDDELLSYNEQSTFLENVKDDVADHDARDQVIVTAKVCSSNDVKYATVQGDECAYVTSYYFSREGNDFTKTFQEYCLRKDGDGRWKILTFRLTEGDPDDYE